MDLQETNLIAAKLAEMILQNKMPDEEAYRWTRIICEDFRKIEIEERELARGTG
jgi:hypothetical protein